MHPIDQRLQELGLVLPQCTRPVGNYLPAYAGDNLLFISGQFPFLNGNLEFTGQVGRDLSIEEAYEAARLAALNALAHIKAETDNWHDLRSIVRVDGYISSAHDWFEQPAVLDGASDLLKLILGERAGHARTVFACNQLPMNAVIELVVTAALEY